MPGAGLISIKRRIKSVTNTRKITKAMGLVATAKLRKARAELMVNDKYYSAIKESVDALIKAADEPNGIYFKNNSNNKLFIVFTSDTGLCGGFNASVVSYTVNSIKESKENSSIMIVGQKGRNYFNKLGYKTVAEYVDIPDVPTMKEAKTIYDHAFKLYEEGSVGEVYLVYTKFVSPVKQVITEERILPIVVNDEDNIAPQAISFETNMEENIGFALDIYLKGKILNSMIHAKASEHGSRMSAMDGATNNANDILEKLNLKYNRIRQSAITQEISEIVGGAEAQK